MSIPPCRQRDDCRDVEACGTCSVTGQSPVPTSFSLRQISSSSRVWCLDSVHQRKSCEGVDEESLLEPSQQLLTINNKKLKTEPQMIIDRYCVSPSASKFPWIFSSYTREINGILLLPLPTYHKSKRKCKQNHDFSLTVALGTSASFGFSAGF